MIEHLESIGATDVVQRSAAGCVIVEYRLEGVLHRHAFKGGVPLDIAFADHQDAMAKQQAQKAA